MNVTPFNFLCGHASLQLSLASGMRRFSPEQSMWCSVVMFYHLAKENDWSENTK
jgi:hypothetical protein